ncbi:hypothetical protein V8E53_013213 [Lactarius tabidus]
MSTPHHLRTVAPSPSARISMQKKWMRERAAKEGQDHSSPIAPTPQDNNIEEESDTELKHKKIDPVTFKDRNTILAQLKRVFNASDHVFFYGCYDLPADLLIPEKEHVNATAHNIWRVTGYCFQIKDHLPLETGHKTRKLNISCCTNPRSKVKIYTISIWLEHHMKHTPYYDVSLPPEAMAMIQENIECHCPSKVVKKVLLTHPSVTTKQVHAAWTMMSETLWKRSNEQLASVKVLLGKYQDNVAILDLLEREGVEQITWVMKKVVSPLCGKIVEIGIDATCERQSED